MTASAAETATYYVCVNGTAISLNATHVQVTDHITTFFQHSAPVGSFPNGTVWWKAGLSVE